MDKLYYTGVGSRRISTIESAILTHIAIRLEQSGMILRTGGATGSDSAFEMGVEKAENKIVYLAWPDANRPYGIIPEFTQTHFNLINHIHPNPRALTPGSLRLHARNINQVAGDSLTKPIFSKFLICCSDPTDDGLVYGGTRTAVVVAKMCGVPVYNIRVEKDLELIRKSLNI